jgi:flagellar hook-associated protein 2
MGISSIGIGSGLDVKSIISQLMAIEQQPIAQLQTQASSLNTKLSAFGQIKSQMANLQDMAQKLADQSNWNAMSVTSSNASAITGTATEAAAATSFSVEVSQLARAQAVGSVALPSASPVGAGSLHIDLGNWSTGTPPVFTAGGTAVDVQVGATDTPSQIADKINAAGAGVTATVLKDTAGDRLLLRSNATGESSAFRIQALDSMGNQITNGTGLGQLAYDPANVATGGMSLTQTALNTKATINGVAVTSQSNTLNAVAGLTLSVSQVTTAPVEITIQRDTSAAKKAINDFVTSYNSINAALAEMTRYDPATKTAGTLQGDSTAVGLQTALRRLLSGNGPAGTPLRNLSDLGVEFQSDGSLQVNASKLDTALKKSDDVKNFFTAAAGESALKGMALRIKDFADGLIGVNGALTSRTNSIQSAINRNSKDQTNLQDRLTQTQTRLQAQYSRLDATMGSLTALSNYVNQQVTLWNKNSNN